MKCQSLWIAFRWIMTSASVAAISSATATEVFPTRLSNTIVIICADLASARQLRDQTVATSYAIAATDVAGCALVSADRYVIWYNPQSPPVLEGRAWMYILDRESQTRCPVIWNGRRFEYPCSPRVERLRYFAGFVEAPNGQRGGQIIEIPDRNVWAEIRAYLERPRR